MARSKSTLIPVMTQAIYVRKEPATNGGFYYHFQAPDYMSAYDLVITPDMAMSNISDWDTHTGNIKIRISDTNMVKGEYAHLDKIERGKVYGLFFASNPQSITNDKGQISAVYEQQVLRAVAPLPDNFWEQQEKLVKQTRENKSPSTAQQQPVGAK